MNRDHSTPAWLQGAAAPAEEPAWTDRSAPPAAVPAWSTAAPAAPAAPAVPAACPQETWTGPNRAVEPDWAQPEPAPVEQTWTEPIRPPAPPHQPTNRDLVAGALLKRPRRAPDAGWRAAVHRISGGAINPGQSGEEQRLQALVERINQPIRGDYRIAFLSLKGGVGKTTTTVGLGSTFASMRGDQVIAVDANPDMGTLATRVPLQTASTVRDLLADAPNLRRYSDVRRHTSQAESRLEVLASEQDPAMSEAFSEADYRSVIDILQVYYNIILTDCGTGIMHSAMNGVLQLANSLVLVSSPAIDGARSAAATLDWLQHHGYGHLVERTVVVISSARPGASTIDLDELSRHFLARCRAVQVVPFDEHLAEGAEIDLNLLRPATRRAFVELAAMVADDFPASSGRHAVAEWS